jgi:aryl-alcohol dehydrogenase-like predicted oxidoreductase
VSRCHYSLAEMVAPVAPGCLSVTPAELNELDRLSVTLLAWASIAGGYFARRDTRSWSSVSNARRRKRANNLAAHLGVAVSTVALAYVLRQPGRVLAVVGTRVGFPSRGASGAATLSLSIDEIGWLDAN